MKKKLGNIVILVVGLGAALCISLPVILSPWTVYHGRRVMQPLVEELQTQYPGVKITYGASYEGGKGSIHVHGTVSPALQMKIKESVAALKAKYQITLRIHLEFETEVFYL